MLDSPYFTWIILPLLIFSARAIDVSIGTLRIVYIARGHKIIAPILGFFEILIWLLAIGQIFKHLDNALCYIAYAGGFATGNFIGMFIENKLAIGLQVIRIITRLNTSELISALKKDGFGITVVDAEGATGPVKIIFTLIQRKDLQKVLEMIHRNNPKAFYTVEDVQQANDLISTQLSQDKKRFYRYLFKMDRKSK